ncbi:MAG: DUF565 domain-containing protein [Leptolyngbyaceae bacterium]|nr:DUF565 domain-containing protein [Leptolyngbyaceae bacterium]
MQDTRLTTLINRLIGQIQLWLVNPWRRISLVVIGLLFGFFLANVISTVTGQTADLDVLVSLMMLTFTELASWFVYSNRRLSIETNQRPRPQPLGTVLLNAVKIGVIYGLFLDAFKLGS